MKLAEYGSVDSRCSAAHMWTADGSFTMIGYSPRVDVRNRTRRSDSKASRKATICLYAADENRRVRRMRASTRNALHVAVYQGYRASDA